MQDIRQSALADFGVAALRTDDLDPLLREACVQVARALKVPIAKIALRRPGGSDLILQAAVGIPDHVARPGMTSIPGGKGSAMGFTLQAGVPIISHTES